MSSDRYDYQQFLTWLHRPGRDASEDARRFANLVDANFDQVAANTRAQSRRSTALVAIAREVLSATDFENHTVAEKVNSGTWLWATLQSLTLGPFRGFRVPETFHFPQRITMIYGPNGSGKTSVCEALELALLGAVDEASAKRIPPQRYFANLHEGRFIAPVVAAVDSQGAASAVSADSEEYRFCFIEKNRIDNFSRIAAKTTGEKKNLIASLFGMEQFHEFVTNFNESLDGQLSLIAARQNDLETRRASLQRDRATVDGETLAAQAITSDEETYAGAFSAGLSHKQLLTLIGSDDTPGRLQDLNAQLDAPAPALYGVSSAKLLAAYQTADAAQKRLDDVLERLGSKTGETSFQSLYNAVLVLQASNPENCPACGTPLAGEYRAVHDPYLHARQGLEQLKDLAALQIELARVRREWDVASRGLENLLSHLAQRVTAEIASQDERLRYLAEPGVDHSKAWWHSSYVKSDGREHMARKLCDLAGDCERIDLQTNTALANRAQLAQERARLVKAGQAIASFVERRAELGRQVAIAKQAIANFDLANAQLIEAVRQEAVSVKRDLRIKLAYDEFLRLLRQFRAELPGTLIAGLNTTALDIYNEFNRHDHNGDKLAALSLPTTEDGRVNIAFRAAPQTTVDALHVLSEGHVRCLGVAILLAKALDVQAPTIIFDDAINAIDTEHREGIREVVFQSDRFAKTQIIVTCHSSEFIKDLQNHIAVNQWTSYYLMPHAGDYRPRVKGNEQTFNYLLQARAALDMGDWRNALGAARQSLEVIADKVWNWLGKHDHGQLTVPLARRGTEPALRNLCEALKKRLDETHAFVHPDKPILIKGLGAVLGVPAPSNVWLYLNKGIHEEPNRDDYDHNLVRLIVENLEMLNQLKLGKMTAAMANAAQAAAGGAVATLGKKP